MLQIVKDIEQYLKKSGIKEAIYFEDDAVVFKVGNTLTVIEKFNEETELCKVNTRSVEKLHSNGIRLKMNSSISYTSICTYIDMLKVIGNTKV